MAIGGSLAYFNIPSMNKVIKNLLSIISFCAILYTSFTIDQDSSRKAPLHLSPISNKSKYHLKKPWRGGRFDVIN